MGFFSVRKMVWKEPEAFRCKEDKRSIIFNAKFWWFRPVAIFVFTLIYILIWCGNKFLLHREKMHFISGCGLWIVLMLLLMYGCPWLLRRLPCSVALYSNGIMKMGENSIRWFKSLSGYAWSEEGSYHVLHLITKKGVDLRYGVPDLRTRDKIEAVLNQYTLEMIASKTSKLSDFRRLLVSPGRDPDNELSGLP